MRVIPLLIRAATKDPQGVGHLVGLLAMLGAKLLNAIAIILKDLLGGR